MGLLKIDFKEEGFFSSSVQWLLFFLLTAVDGGAKAMKAWSLSRCHSPVRLCSATHNCAVTAAHFLSIIMSAEKNSSKSNAADLPDNLCYNPCMIVNNFAAGKSFPFIKIYSV